MYSVSSYNETREPDVYGYCDITTPDGGNTRLFRWQDEYFWVDNDELQSADYNSCDAEMSAIVHHGKGRVGGVSLDIIDKMKPAETLSSSHLLKWSFPNATATI